MTAEGMVHALEEIHRLFKPGGSLIDIHPFAEASLIEVYQEGGILFTQPKPDCSTEDYRLADLALEKAVQRNLYTLESAGQFHYLIYSSSIAELCDYAAMIDAYAEPSDVTAITAQEAEMFARAGLIQGEAGMGAEVASHSRVHITRLIPVK